MSATAVTIDVVSDVVCPWCYLGKRRLERARVLMAERDIAVRWRPFRLDPTIPPEGITRDAYLTGKFGSVEAVADMHGRLTELGREVGIDYHFERITRSPNTVDAHRLVGWAAADGLQEAMVERLFAAYLGEGLDVGDSGVLVELAGEVGLDAQTVADRLDGDEDRAAVTNEIENAYRIGVTGVPCFIIGQRYAVMGAQSPETLAAAITEVATLRPGAQAADRVEA